MAKISARGATEVARVRSEIGASDTEFHAVYTHVLRSDRAVLRKSHVDSGYRIVGRVPTHIPEGERVAFFERYVARFVAARS